MVHQSKAWTNAACKAKKEQLKVELKCQGLEEKLEAKEKELRDAHAQIVELKKEKEDAIDDYMDSDDFKKLMDAHDDIPLPQQHTLGWRDALRAVLAKHPGLFVEGDFQAPFLPEGPPAPPISPETHPLAIEKAPEKTPEKTTDGSSSSKGTLGSSSSGSSSSGEES